MLRIPPTRVLTAFLEKEGFLRAFARRFFRDDDLVDDLCQETITRALEAERSRVIDSPDAFLFGIARNIVRKQLDVRSRSLVDFLDDFAPDEVDSGAPDIEQTLDDRARMMRFAESVLKLPPQCQRVFIMKRVYGYSHGEISAKLGISISTIEKHAATAMKRCLDDLESDAGADLSIVTDLATRRGSK
ncbi:MAG: sigma-70 family RNA polymerase sigma factor [Proteobacteria bacterium]|nr:sigma-70 family RNA polymerase sigma factor [Pseudomonadota bacterium]MDA1302252.1 sigma-70 family RNA polymerase sigma factor [Pseudomonadota bacterium]